jgi:sugar phosphate isomerase/epimerase
MRLIWFALIALTAAPFAGAQTTHATTLPIDHGSLKKLNWQLAARTFIFKDITVFEALDYVAPLGVHHVELRVNQRITAEHPDWLVSSDMPDDQINAIRQRLTERHLDVVSYDASAVPNDEPKLRKLFDLAKKFGAKTIVCEPDPHAPSLMDKLAGEYGISVAVINVPAPAQYADCHSLIMVTSGKSNHFGACPDIVDLRGSGDNPKQCVAQLKGHVIAVRVKDVSAHRDDIKAALKQLKDDGFKGVVCVDALGNSASDSKNKLAASLSDASSVISEVAK